MYVYKYIWIHIYIYAYTYIYTYLQYIDNSRPHRFPHKNILVVAHGDTVAQFIAVTEKVNKELIYQAEFLKSQLSIQFNTVKSLWSWSLNFFARCHIVQKPQRVKFLKTKLCIQFTL